MALCCRKHSIFFFFFGGISQVNIKIVIFVSCNSLAETAACHSLSERRMHCVLEHLSNILRSNGERVRGQPPGGTGESGGQKDEDEGEDEEERR